MILRVGTVYDTEAFQTLYSYDGDDLGLRYSPGGSRFCVWAPTASAVNLLLYDGGVPEPDEQRETVCMARSTKGTWTVFVNRDIKGRFYTYQAFVNGKWTEAVDPYAVAVGVNGLRGQVIDLRETDPEGWEFDERIQLKNPVDAIIYELHVRDLSSQPISGIANAGKYIGLAERGTVSPDGLKTGLDHILELGVTHVKLLPVYDYKAVDEASEAPQFNWGYDPQNYNAPEGSYSTDPYNGAVRANELKQTVKALHGSGLGVIIDVTYNHMYDAGDSCLERLVPGYYFRTDADGNLSNGSGCGNEIASERHMVRKYIADSVVYWANEYHIDGFRFDLMGLHDIETMNFIRERLDEIDPAIFICGEGWTGGESPLPQEERADKANLDKLSGIAVFNDNLRDGIKGSVFNKYDKGFAGGDFGRADDVKRGIAGEGGPAKYINYCSCHDNHTLWDKLGFICEDEDKREAMNRLSSAILLTSQGIPFIHAGEETARTKYGDGNSYRSPDSINQLDWTRKAQYIELFNYYKGFISLRKTFPEFRMSSYEEVAGKLKFMENIPYHVIGYTLDDKFLLLFNAGGECEIPLPSGAWNILADGRRAGVTAFARAENVLKAEPVSAYVLKRAGKTYKKSQGDNKEFNLIGKLLLAMLAAGAVWGISRVLRGRGARR